MSQHIIASRQGCIRGPQCSSCEIDININNDIDIYHLPRSTHPHCGMELLLLPPGHDIECHAIYDHGVDTIE